MYWKTIFLLCKLSGNIYNKGFAGFDNFLIRIKPPFVIGGFEFLSKESRESGMARKGGKNYKGRGLFFLIFCIT